MVLSTSPLDTSGRELNITAADGIGKSASACVTRLDHLSLPDHILALADNTRHRARSRTVRIPFVSNKHATIAKQVIDVDAELQKDAVRRILTVEGQELVATFQTLTIRLARLAVNGFLENIDLVIGTMEEFGQEADSQVTQTGK